MRFKLGWLVLSGIAYGGSYHLAYGNQGLCVDKPILLEGLDYVYMGALSLLRGLCLLIGYLHYFARLDSPSGSHG